jgi:hypothetical protein
MGGLKLFDLTSDPSSCPIAFDREVLVPSQSTVEFAERTLILFQAGSGDERFVGTTPPTL